MRKNTKLILDDLVEAMQFHKDAANAGPMASYMKNKFAFLGIKQPLRKELSAGFIKTSKTLEGREIIALCNALWKMPEREFQLIALELLYASRKQWNEEFLLFFNTIVERKAWWDTIDFIATKLYGGYYAGTKRPPQMLQWSKSADIWQNRVAILFQLNYKDKTDKELLFEIIERLKGNKEFFIQKAIGWSLRQYYRSRPGVVEKFVTTAGLNGLAKREALKHA